MPDASDESRDLVVVGAISGAFGVRGEVRVRSFTADVAGVVSYGPLCDAAGRVVLTPKRWRPIKDGLAVTAPEVKTREQAEALRNTALHVRRANLPPPDEDEFYHVDLIGCRVETLDGTALGEVVAVHDFGAGDLLAVRGADGKTHYLPFTREAAPVVDLLARRIVVIPPTEAEDDEAEGGDEGDDGGGDDDDADDVSDEDDATTSEGEENSASDNAATDGGSSDWGGSDAGGSDGGGAGGGE